MNILIAHQPIAEATADIIIVPAQKNLDFTQIFSKEVSARIVASMKKAVFTGEWGRAELFIAPQGVNAPLIAVLGIGKEADDEDKYFEGLRRALAIVLMDARVHMVSRIAILAPSVSDVSPIVESLMLTNYWFTEHSKAMAQDAHMRSLKEAVIHVSGEKEAALAKKEVKKTHSILRGVELTRHLVNQPASHMSPNVLVQEAKKIAKTSKNISITVLNRKQAQVQKWFGFLAVARGSKEEPYVIHLKYRPKKKPKKTLVLIGKGITFDSGGLSLKPSIHMENMKIDMAGGATVLGLFSLLPILAPDIAIHGIIAACENMPSGDAYRPGDVVDTMSGKKIEVLNTDAEGRVTLADALTYAQTLKPDAIIDLATLTGACVVALGETYAGLFGNSQSLNTLIKESAKKTGEGVVEFPLPEEYRSTVQSMIGDVRNTSAMKTGGAITAALFLQEFIEKNKVGEAVPWAHMDIAGPVYAEMPLIPYWQFGATGYGVRTLVNVVEEFGK
ncbi:MAG: leucyl aminopeptidase [Candidatus Andersenbacteria bacterium]|nr:leucyl aminopeptidase [Candidatus Andersenbacteria bacterium]